LVNQDLSKKIVYKAPAAHLERLGIYKRTENATDLSRPLLKKDRDSVSEYDCHSVTFGRKRQSKSNQAKKRVELASSVGRSDSREQKNLRIKKRKRKTNDS
jgi:hypothetical protein